MNSCRPVLKFCFGILAVLLYSPGCSITPPEIAEVEVQARGEKLYLSNNTNSPVYYAVFSRDLLLLTGGVRICPDPNCHEKIPPQQKAVVPYAQFLGDTNDDEAVIYWWHLIPDKDQGYQADELRSIVVKL